MKSFVLELVWGPDYPTNSPGKDERLIAFMVENLLEFRESGNDANPLVESTIEIITYDYSG